MIKGMRQSDEKYIIAVATHPDPVVTTGEIADELNVSTQAVYSKFVEFVEDGLMESKKTGGRAKVWWLSTDGREAYAELKQ